MHCSQHARRLLERRSRHMCHLRLVNVAVAVMNLASSFFTRIIARSSPLVIWNSSRKRTREVGSVRRLLLRSLRYVSSNTTFSPLKDFSLLSLCFPTILVKKKYDQLCMVGGYSERHQCDQAWFATYSLGPSSLDNGALPHLRFLCLIGSFIPMNN